MKIFGSIQELVSLVYRKGSSQITLRPNSGTTYAADRAVDLPPGDSAHVLVSETATQSLTNKTINVTVGNNSISNLPITSLLTVLADANKVLLRDSSGAVISGAISNANIDAAANIALTKLATVTASRALASDGSGNISASSITATELGHLSGVTSNIQTQLNSKEGTITVLPISKGGTNSSTSLNNNRVMVSSGSAIVEAAAITASRALASNASGLPTASATTSTELGYLSGVTSAVQTQINAKADTSALTAHTGASSGVHGVTGSVVGTTDTQALTNKDIDGGTASNTSRLTLPKATKSTLDGLNRKEATLVFGTDTDKVYVDNGTTLKEIGGSGSGGTNYLQDWYDGSNPIGTVLEGVGGSVNSTANRPVANKNSWYVSSLINIEPANNTTNPLRSSGDILINSKTAVIGPSVETPMFQIDNADLGKPVSIQFDITGLLSSATHDIVVIRYNNTGVHQEIISVAGTASTGTPASAYLPSGTTTFKGFFIASNTSTDYYSLRIRKLVAVDNDFQIDSLFVGPQSLAQGAVITKYQDWTPTGSWSSNTAYAGKWRRVGNMMEIDLAITLSGAPTASALTVNLPSGYTIDSNSIALSSGSLTPDRVWFGDVSIGNADGYFGKVGYNSSTSVRLLSTNASGTYLKDDTITNLVPKTLGSGDFITAHFSVPINEWSSGTTTLADRAVEEYAWNSDTSNASNTSAFGYGPDGVNFLSTTPATASISKRVRFQTPIQPTDLIIFEVNTNGLWRQLSAEAATTAGQQIYTYITHYNNAYGAGRILQVNSTDVDVSFAKYASTGTTYDSASGGAWGSITAGTAKWRLRKVSGGAAVGFPVSARNVVGDTSGTTVPAGYVGEQLSQTWTGQTITTSTTTLATHSFVQTGVYLFIIETDCSKGSATRITSSFSGTATISVTKTASGGDYVTMLDATGACLYATYYARVTGAGSITFTSQATTANATSSRGSFSIVRIA